MSRRGLSCLVFSKHFKSSWEFSTGGNISGLKLEIDILFFNFSVRPEIKFHVKAYRQKIWGRKKKEKKAR